MKTLLTNLLLLCFFMANAQDTVFTTPILKCIYSKDKKCPKLISYKLYKGGGECKRETLHTFEAYKWTASNKDYVHSGYDKGHMANAEDFAFDCEKEALTFECYNIIPQIHTFNAGLFKTYETNTRKWSQSDSLQITYINTISDQFIGNGTHNVDRTFKIVQSLSTKKILLCGKFIDVNSTNPTFVNMSLEDVIFETGIKFYVK